MSLNWDKYSALYWCFCVRISFILLLIKWTEMDPNAGYEATDLGFETLDQANYNSIPEYNVVLITLSSYPLNMHSWTYLQRYEGTANYFTKNHDRREIELSCNSAHTQAEGRNQLILMALQQILPYWMVHISPAYIPRLFYPFCRKQSVPYWSSLFNENVLHKTQEMAFQFRDPKFEKFLGEHAPRLPPCLGRLGIGPSNSSSPALGSISVVSRVRSLILPEERLSLFFHHWALIS